MLYFTGEVFCRLANQNRGHIRVMLEYLIYQHHFATKYAIAQISFMKLSFDFKITQKKLFLYRVNCLIHKLFHH